MTTKKNPTDMTTRNTQAANKKFAKLRQDVRDLIARVRQLEKASKK